MLTQIYGITTAADAALVNALRPDHVGVVLDEGIATWDSVDPASLREILPELRDVRVVALSLASERDRIRRTVDLVTPSWLHLARAVDALDPDEVVRLREELRRCP
jgi:phosphoribosylanthranilate isomerase